MAERNHYTLKELERWEEFAPSLNPPARLAVIGDPIAHSRSPQMHHPALQARGIPAQYIRVQVPPGKVGRALELFAKHNFVGVNCTIPHKFEALEAMDEISPLARLLGAVNTVHLLPGHMVGYNSDGPGFLNSVEEAFSKKVRDLRVLILGAGGGAGRAVAVQCALEKCPSLVLANRTVEKLAPLVEECRELSPTTTVQSTSWDDAALASVLPDIDLIVNATPRGMKDGDEPLFNASLLEKRHLVYDMVYRANGTTPLAAAARAAGAATCDGLTLLLHQGAISFGHWFGAPVPLDDMRQGLASA